MANWIPVSDKDKYGIVISNLKPSIVLPHRLSLSVGDTVYIAEKNGNWYYGCNLKQKSRFGIFPKNYICLKECVVDKTGQHEVVIPREPQIIQEITAVLREWGSIWKQLYITSHSKFKIIREMMIELIEWRKQIMSGTLPADELKELKKKVTSKIDQGNAILGLDLVVRDEQNNILNPEITSTIDLFRAHEQATQRIKQNYAGFDSKSQKPTTKYIHNLLVTVNHFTCRIGEDSDLLLTLYDAKENKFISENYLVQWGKQGLTKDLDQLNNLSVVFSDLGSKDLLREKIYLVCQVIRIGGMELKEPDPGRTIRKSSVPGSKKASEGLRRPCGVAARDITEYFNDKNESTEEKRDILIPFVPCGERDTLDSVIRKIISSREIKENPKGYTLSISVKMLHGDMKQIKEEYAHLVSPFTAVARKMGFPEVILPGDVRNDLYLTLVQGEFSKGTKKSERNIEVTVRICNEKGSVIPNAITIGAGGSSLSEYKSVIYYHEERPKWMETFKVAIPIEEFYGGHLKFTFRHRSSNDNKDKSEKPFAMSFVKLMNENGTTLWDKIHDLLVYKVDHKKYDDSEVSYLKLPATKTEMECRLLLTNNQSNQMNAKQLCSMFQANGMMLSPKDSFNISTIVCSTKLTQNIDLLGLLKWKSNKENLKSNLLALMKVDGEEIVKFLQDTLDALFDILMQNTDSDIYDNLVFEALIFIIGLISDRKYQHFRPVLDVYIQENFSATLVYNKLIAVLMSYINDVKSMAENQDILLRAMKSLEYIFKVIVRSRMLYAALNGGKGKSQFEDSLKKLLNSITNMMLSNDQATLLVQGACMKYFPFAITDILFVFNENELSYILADLINNVPVDRLTKQKMMCINDIVHCVLFTKYAECRSILLPVINDNLRLLLEKNQELELCVTILSDMLVVLYGRDVGPTKNDISDIMKTLLRTVIQSVINIDRKNSLVANLVTIMIGILRQMTVNHYKEYLDNFVERIDLLDFLMEILLVFRDLVNKNVFPSDWNEMIMLQNSVILNSLRHFALAIRENFLQPFEVQLWNNFFHCSISFLTQDPLQLENFSLTKRNKIYTRYKDMRRDAASEIRAMWFHLGRHKIEFVPNMIGPFLEMTLIPEIELRKATISIFFDMMQCEFYSPRNLNYSFYENTSNYGTKEVKGNFKMFEDEMITQLDMLIEGGKGDSQFKDEFHQIVGTHCESHPVMREQGLFFVKTVVRLMRRLLEYRSVINDENKENRMSCTVNLLEFYNEIGRKEMYIRYLYKLCDLHLECDNYIEAAYTLSLHATLLKWSDESIPHLLKNEKYSYCETQRELKERLYGDIIDYFDRGKLWEAGLVYCKELINQYESEVFDYTQLSGLLQRMALFYENIMKQARPEPEYFRVAYYGRGFPAFLQNKTFVYRGKEYERLSEFSGRLLNQFPNAQLLTKLGPPGDEITESPNGQYLQINKVEPVMQERERFKAKIVHDQILRYYKVNEVQKFTYSRPLRKGNRDSDNEFATMWIERTILFTSYPLPGILRRFPVTNSNTFELSPLENAIETMESTNKKICHLILQYRSDQNLPLNPLSMTLNGIVDAAVMGGIINYEKAFFTEEYMTKHPYRKEQEEIVRLKDLIALQIPLLDAGILIHKKRAPVSLRPFHDHMEAAFAKLKINVEDKYGKRSLPPELEFVQVRDNLNRSTNKGPSKGHISVPNRQFDRESPSENSKVLSGRSVSVWVKPSQTSQSSSSSGTNLFGGNNTISRIKKQLTKDSGLPSRRSNNESNSQWYDVYGKSDSTNLIITSPNTNQQIIELTEHLSSHRPLRTEPDRRSSRPSSGGHQQYRNHATPSPTRSLSHGASSNSLSISPQSHNATSTNSLITNDNDVPPPLPAKQYADYTNLDNDYHGSNGFDLSSRRNSHQTIKNKLPPPLPDNDVVSPRATSPPELPKKPQRPVPIPVQNETNEPTIN